MALSKTGLIMAILVVILAMGVGIVSGAICPFEDPKIISTDPLNGQTDVSIAASIFVNFDREVERGYAFGNIEVIEQGTNRKMPITKMVTGNQLKIKPKTSWIWLRTYVVTIPRGAVKSIYGNPLPSDFTFSFTIEEMEPPSGPPFDSEDNNILNYVPGYNPVFGWNIPLGQGGSIGR
jgi:hypothetical protein